MADTSRPAITVIHGEAPLAYWEAWHQAYPQRAADARKYLRYERTEHGVYWYRDTRNGKLYGLPELERILDCNDALYRNRTQLKQRQRRIRTLLWAVTIGSILGVGVVYSIAPLNRLDPTPVVLAIGTIMGLLAWKFAREPKADYRSTVDVAYREFLSDKEIFRRKLPFYIGGMLGAAWLASRWFDDD